MKRENVEIVSTDGCQVFSVPNTITGREFVRLLRVYINTDRYAIRARGRAQDRKKKGGNGQDIRAKRADWLAVYVHGLFLRLALVAARRADRPPGSAKPTPSIR